MQPIGSDYEIESTPASVLKVDVDAVCSLLQGNHFIVEDDLGFVLNGLEQQAREIAAPERHETCHLLKHPRSKAGELLAAVIDDPKFAHPPSGVADLVREAHALGNVVSEAPKVDNVAAASKGRRPFDDGRFKSNTPASAPRRQGPR
jgi:hypothetical protein